ncbi:Takeout/JHBP like protein [Operophtera brumata]|uniref:Takeout/JHBP like protein n=1 Tax=Operophtera brumata TaxID=104452 RepID=A0A0L7LB60_OPEBR|nr:Takeout/JHBP like protein [Operophtera brumata]
MDAGHLGMKPIDPATINSVTVAIPELQMSFLLRNLNVTGARWTKLVERRFGLGIDKSGVLFHSDLHVTGDIIMTSAGRLDPYFASITMDIQGVETNITYSWRGQRGIDNYDYILLGKERIAVRNTRTPSFFLQPKHISNEITAALMHSIVDNFRLFARTVPVHHYYKLYQ